MGASGAALDPERTEPPGGEPGVARRLRELRDEALAEVAAGPVPVDASSRGVPIPDERELYPAKGETPRGAGSELPPDFLDRPPIDLHTWYDVWARDVPVAIRSHRPGIGSLIVWVKRLLRKFVRAPIADLFDRQRAYNAVLVHNVTALQESVRVLSERSVPAIVQRGDALHAVQDQRLEAALHDLRRLEDRLQELGPPAAGEHRAELPTSASRLSAETRALQHQLAAVRDEMTIAGGAEASSPDGHARLRQSLDRLASRLPLDVERLCGAPAGESQLGFYVPLFRDLPGPVVGLGAGSGGLLELCRAEGIDAYGVDAGADVVGHLASLPDGTLGGVFVAQVVEQLPPPRLLELARLCAAKVAAGGRVAMEAQNPSSLAARRPGGRPAGDRTIHPEGLRLLLEAAGFPSVEVRYLSPDPEAAELPRIALDGLPGGSLRHRAQELDASVVNLNQLLFGHRDHAVLARR